MVVAPRLDNVLKRAEELEKMDKSTEALDSLYETLVSKRARSLSLPQLETLFTKFIQLSVELRRGKFIKDGLHQYKKLALASGPEGVQSLVRCIDHLLAISEEAVAKAQQLSLLAWYVYAPQCISTLAVMRRETRSLKVVLGAAAYLFGLAYVAALLTYHVTRALTGAPS